MSKKGFFFFLQCLSGAFIAKPPLQITKKYKFKHYYKEKVGRKPKSEQKLKKLNGQQEQSIRLKSEQCAGEADSQHCEFSQVAKFLQPCKIPAVTQFPCIFYFSFLLVSDLQC